MYNPQFWSGIFWLSEFLLSYFNHSRKLLVLKKLKRKLQILFRFGIILKLVNLRTEISYSAYPKTYPNFKDKKEYENLQYFFVNQNYKQF